MNVNKSSFTCIYLQTMTGKKHCGIMFILMMIVSCLPNFGTSLRNDIFEYPCSRHQDCLSLGERYGCWGPYGRCMSMWDRNEEDAQMLTLCNNNDDCNEHYSCNGYLNSNWAGKGRSCCLAGVGGVNCNDWVPVIDTDRGYDSLKIRVDEAELKERWSITKNLQNNKSLKNIANPVNPGTLGECEGECDKDSECKKGLKCFQRDGLEEVPGCIGKGTNDWDYCYNDVIEQITHFEVEMNKCDSTSTCNTKVTHFDTMADKESLVGDGVDIRQLEPGQRYYISLTPKQIIGGKTSTLDISFKIDTYVSTHCSCDSDMITKQDGYVANFAHVTGKPNKFAVSQDEGYVTFSFEDASRCEDSFAFARILADGKSATENVFTPNYYITSRDECDTKINPGHQASDDLHLSNLIVGKEYQYCVRATAKDYMAYPFDESEPNLVSSDDACATHTVKWEASIAGIVTTDPNSGQLPIRDVFVSWELIHPDTNKVIQSGNDTTEEGGTFGIKFKTDDSQLTNDHEFPVNITFSKTSTSGNNSIYHEFLCNDGQLNCTYGAEKRVSVYLKHLKFDHPMHVYDTTSVPVKGKVVVGDTASDESGDGCPVVGAEVCLMDIHARTDKTQGVCVETDYNGDYEAPATIGSTVSVKVNYHNHTIIPTVDNGWDYEKGVFIDINDKYERNDFVDISKARLFVEVAGGLCNHTLGTSAIQVEVSGGCKWTGNYTQDDFKEAHLVPAHVLDISVSEVKQTETGKPHNHIGAFFADYGVETISLLDATTEEEELQQFENKSGNSAGDEAVQEEEALEENHELVRFQFNGDLEIDFQPVIENDSTADCSTSKAPNGDITFSLHVASTQSTFEPVVLPKYKLLDGDVPLYCHIVSDDMKVRVENKVGVDELYPPAFDDFYATIKNEDSKVALRQCEEEADCLFSVEQEAETPDGQTYSRMIPRNDLGEPILFLTGRPNYNHPYTKPFTIKVNDPFNKAVTKVHQAEFIVTGDFDEGIVGTFALPTYKPLLVLRDPPGGLSTASYENVQSTIKVKSSSVESFNGFDASLAAGPKASFEAITCAGAGVGIGAMAIGMGCFLTLETGTDFAVATSGGVDFVTEQESDQSTSHFTTTWSYITSDDPLLAGPDSDVMVVPNLNVQFNEVKTVRFESDTCLVPEPISKQTFNVKAEGNEPALSFLNMKNIKEYTIPELERSIALKEAELVEDPEDTTLINDNQTLNDALEGWNIAVQEYDATNLEAENGNLNIAPREWFIKWAAPAKSISMQVINPEWEKRTDCIAQVPPATDCPEQFITELHTSPSLAKDHNAGFVSDALRSDAEPFAFEYMKDEEGQLEYGNGEDLKTTNRIHFSGGGSTMEFSLGHMTSIEDEQLDPDATPDDNSVGRFNIGGKGEGLLKSLVGFKLDFETEYNYETSHTKTVTDSTEKATSISFVLGDADWEDEFVTDISIDPKHGTFVFRTIDGSRSKNPCEQNTICGEKPSIDLVAEGKPTRPVMPDEDMVFTLNIANNGVSASNFLVFLDHTTNEGSLELYLSGSSLRTELGYAIKANTGLDQFLTIKRGPKQYLYEAVTLVMIGDWDGQYNMEADTTEVYNYIDNNGKKWIKFEEPCPKVEWAGTLKKDRRFLVNQVDTSVDLTIYNPDHSDGSFEKQASKSRLENVFIKYRLLGDTDWDKARTANGTEINLATPTSNADWEEDSYGYYNIPWEIGGVLTRDGTYELMVETVCETVPGAPDDFNSFGTNPIIGAVDREEPKLYGSPLPLRDVVIPGEEIVLMFAEPILCTQPYRFDIEVLVSGIDRKFDDENLNILCQDRKLSFQFDQANVNYDELMGSEMSVSVSGVSDRNLNVMNSSPITFTKMIADLNLNEVTTTFTFTLSDCDDDEVSIKNQIAGILGLTDPDRIQVSNNQCQNGESIATVTIGSSNTISRRRLRSGTAEHAVGLYYSLVNIANTKVGGTQQQKRKLLADDIDTSKMKNFSVRDMKIIPGPSDAKLFKTDPDMVLEEDMIRAIAEKGGDVAFPSFVHQKRLIGNEIKQQLDLWGHSDSNENVNKVVEELRLTELEEIKLMRKQINALEHDAIIWSGMAAILIVLLTFGLIFIWRENLKMKLQPKMKVLERPMVSSSSSFHGEDV